MYHEGSWICPRCGWRYPNPHPSAKHRRSHKKHCGKLEGFELKPEVHRGGSSDEASSDDGDHVDKENLMYNSPQISHGISKPSESNIIPVIDESKGLQSKDLSFSKEILLNGSEAQISIHRITDSFDVRSEILACESSRSKDCTQAFISESHISERLPSNAKVVEASTSLQDDNLLGNTQNTSQERKDAAIKDQPSETANIVASNSLEGHNDAGFPASPEKVDFAPQSSSCRFEQGNIECHKDSVLTAAVHEHIGSIPSLRDSSKDIKEKSLVLLPNMDSNEETRKIHVNDPSQLLEAKEEIYVSSRQHSNNHGGSSHVDDSWTCRYCGWVYPNPRPSAKHRRHHKKHCGKLKELVVEVNFQKGGSSDDTSSGEEEKEHIQDHFPVVEAPNLSDCKKGSYLRTSAEDHGSISLQSTSESKDMPTATDGKISGLYSGGELKHTVSPLQQSAHGCRLGQAIEPDIQTADPCNSKEVGNLQIKEATLNRDAVESDIIDLSCLLETSHKKSSKVMSPEPLLAISHVKGEMMHDFHVPKVVEPDHVTLPPAKVLDSPCTSISETKGTVTFPDPLEETFLINVTPVSISSSSEPINKFKRTPVEDTVEASTKHQLSSSAKAPSSTIPREVESLQNIDGPVQFSTFSGFPKAETGPKENVIVDSFAETLQMDSQHRMKSIPLESESEASVNNPITISLMNTTDLNISDSLKEIDLFLNSTEKEIPVEAINEWEGLQNQGTCANRTSSGSIDIVNTDEGELPAKGKSIIVTSSSNSDRTSHELPLYSENLNTSQTGLQTKEVSSLPAEDNTVTDVISGMPKCPEASCLSDDSAIQPSCPAKVSDGEKTSELGVSLNDLEKAVTSAQKFHPEEKPTDDVNSKGLFLDDKPTISVSSSGPEATTLALPTGEVSETVDVLTTAKDFHSSGFHKQNDSNGAAIVDKDAEVKAADGDSVVKEFRNWEVKDNASFRRDSGSYDLASDQIDNVKKAESTDDTLSTTKNLERNLNEPGIENKDEESKASVVDFVLEESQKWEGKDNTSFGMDSRPCDLGAGEVGNSEKVDSSADILSTAKDPDSLSLHKASSLSEPAFVIKDAKVKATDADPLLEESQNWEIKDNALSGKGFAPHILAANEMASFGKTEFKGIMFTGKDVDLASLHKESNSNESAIVHKDAKAKDANADSVPEESQKWEAKDNTTSGKDSRFHSLCADEMDDFTKAEFASNISSTAKDPYLSSPHELSTLNDPAFVNKEAKIKDTKDSALEESHKWEDEDNTSSGRDFQPDNLGVDKMDSSEKAKNTAVISSTANDPESSSLRDERDLNYPALNKDAELGVTYSDSVLKESQKVETSSGREFGPHSLDSDEMDSFKRAESEFSAFSEFASSSRKLSDSPEIFEDAQDVFDGYSICDGMEMDESLDGSHQDTHAYIEEFKLVDGLRDEKVACVSDVESDRKLHTSTEVHAQEGSAVLPPRTSNTAGSPICELKAPSPEAWQEPGASLEEEMKLSSVEVVEDGKSSESRTALRSLMAKEKKAADIVATSSTTMDSHAHVGKHESSLNGMKSKSRLKSFWRHCICCPNVH